jgi:hypothetical protein
MNTITVSRLGLPAEIYRNQILTLHPSELSSLNREIYLSTYTARSVQYTYTVCGPIPRAFNFADLQGPVPARAYFADCGKALFNGQFDNKTIVKGNHWPTVSLPSAMTSIDPSLFKSCPIQTTYSYANISSRIHLGIWDPPIPLSALTSTSLGAATLKQTAVPKINPVPIITLAMPFPTSTASQHTAHPAESELKQDTSLLLAPTATTVTLKSTITALPASLLAQIGSQSLIIGGLAVSVGGAVISGAPDGNFIVESYVIHNSTEAVLETTLSYPPANVRHPITTMTLTALPSSLLTLIGSQSIYVGSAVTVDGTVVSRASNGDYVVKSTVSLTASERTGTAVITPQKAGVGSLVGKTQLWLYVSAFLVALEFIV